MSKLPAPEWIRNADQQLVRQEVLVVSRPMMVLCQFVNQFGVIDSGAQNAAGKTIDNWYQENYGHVSGLPDRHESRWLVVAGQPFRLRIPFTFNVIGGASVLDHIDGLPDAISEKLDAMTVASLQLAFERFQAQTSSILFFIHMARRTQLSGLVLNLVETGWRDLRTCGDGFRPEDPAGSLCPAQHATEKFMKALLAVTDSSLDEQALRKRYGHRVKELYKSCSVHVAPVEDLQVHVNRLAFDQSIRYKQTPIRPSAVLEAVDSAHHVCAIIASVCVQRLRKQASRSENHDVSI